MLTVKEKYPCGCGDGHKGRNHVYYLCRCDCGKEVIFSGDEIARHPYSCGCTPKPTGRGNRLLRKRPRRTGRGSPASRLGRHQRPVFLDRILLCLRKGRQMEILRKRRAQRRSQGPSGGAGEGVRTAWLSPSERILRILYQQGHRKAPI